jgi:ABC-type antimicrobial peptide transport system permease subunit
VTCNRKLLKTPHPKQLDIIIPYTIESTVGNFGDVGGKDEYLIVGNHSTFFQNISENLPKYYPKSKYLKRIAQYMETLKPEEFSTHLAFNFPERHYWYFYGDFDVSLEYFVNEATKIMKTIGLDSVERRFPILAVLHRNRFTASFLNITLNVILSVLLYIAAMVIYSFISNTANAKVYEIAIERVLGMKK